jgi:hypothetical protein
LSGRRWLTSGLGFRSGLVVVLHRCRFGRRRRFGGGRGRSVHVDVSIRVFRWLFEPGRNLFRTFWPLECLL